MSEVMRKTLVQAIDRLHVLLPDLTRLAAIPGRESRRLDYWSRGSGSAGAGGADQVIDFFLGQDFFHGLVIRCAPPSASEQISGRMLFAPRAFSRARQTWRELLRRLEDAPWGGSLLGRGTGELETWGRR